MGPLQRTPHGADNMTSCDDSATASQAAPTGALNRKWDIMWAHTIFFTILHVAAVHSVYVFWFKAMWTTIIYSLTIGYISAFGITAGTHRLWSHGCYKARLPLQILLLYWQTMCMQTSVIHWVRDHRMHHKYTATDCDPYNSARGFFFAHIGWLLVKKHPDIKAKGHTIDISDVMANPLLRFQDRYYLILAPLACFVIPAYFPTLWGETVWNAFFASSIYRYVKTLHLTCLVNSAAHLWGENKPYDANTTAVESKTVSALAIGEGFHNYHHTFPCDYKASELGHYSLNLTTMFIDLMAKIGWAYDLKTVSSDVVHKRAQRTGDGSHQVSNHDNHW